MFCHGGICCEYFKLNGGFMNKGSGQKGGITQIRPVDGNITPKLESSIQNPTIPLEMATTNVAKYDENVWI
jgi:hypothetical protein